VRARLLEYWRVFSLWGAYSLLATLWGEQAFAFYLNMWPRFGHLGAAGMRVMDRPCFYPQCDFSVFWPAGVLARAGDVASVYAPGAFEVARRQFFGPLVAPMAWYYPPPALLAVTPFSYLPFEPAFYAWSAVLTGLAAWVLRRAGLPWAVVAAGLLSPAGLWNFEQGQWGAVTGAAFLGGLLLMGKREMGGGAALGFLVMKPQAALLAPAALLGAKAWRTAAAAAATAACLAGLATAVFGARVWRDALLQGSGSVGTVLVNPDVMGAAKFGVSVFWMLRGFGAGLVVAGAGQVAAAAAACGVIFWAWRTPRLDHFTRAALTACMAVLVSPHFYTDDMVGYSLALALMAWRRGWQIDWLDMGLFCWPMLTPLVFEGTGLLLTPLVVAVAAVKVAWWGVARDAGAAAVG
jgi:hypothetical protein